MTLDPSVILLMPHFGIGILGCGLDWRCSIPSNPDIGPFTKEDGDAGKRLV
ncbi:hypothetical protein [Mesorhizobium sp. B2-4-17]|uniref:hypothetical protein n=1 Tax=Mesorhizobium sp. B2-4-17 TaxID=2589932 RepID=UPI0015E2C02D|nr:hypothetical protein [Mesorhizobium sp. B2-4-17]